MEIEEDKVTAVGQTMIRDWSAVTRVDRNGQTCFAKEYRCSPDRPAATIRARVAREVDLSLRLRESGLFGTKLGTVVVESADIERFRIVTEEVRGDLLSHCVKAEFCKLTPACLQALFLSGKWLRKFQKLPVTRQDCTSIGNSAPDDLVEYCDLRVQTILETGFGWPDARTRNDIRQVLETSIDQSSESDRRLVWAHHDYAPHNIIWDGRRITPIDFAMARPERSLLDVAYFIHRLEMMRVYRPWKRWPIASWKRAFLRGYERSDAESSPLYSALMIRHLLCRLRNHVRPTRGLKQQLHDRWIRMVISRKLETLISAATR